MMKIFLFNILRGPNKRGGLGSDKRPRRLIEKIGYFDAKSKYEFLSLYAWLAAGESLQYQNPKG